MARPSDTNPEAEQVLREAYRKIPLARRWFLMGDLYHTARTLHAAGVRFRSPHATAQMIRESWMMAALDESLFAEVRALKSTDGDEILPAVEGVIEALSGLGIPYAVAGSWASCLLGKMRYTPDADLLVEPFPGKEAPFCASLSEDYHVSLPAVSDAVRQRSSFHIIHLPTSFKIILRARNDRAFEQSVMARRRPHVLSEGNGQTVTIVSPEDLILLKLDWYRLGGEASEQQWRVVLGVFEIQAGRLDQAYIDRWAAALGVTDLLQRARQESGT